MNKYNKPGNGQVGGVSGNNCCCDNDVANINTRCREAVCVHTDKVYDSCRDKDCSR